MQWQLFHYFSLTRINSIFGTNVRGESQHVMSPNRINTLSPVFFNTVARVGSENFASYIENLSLSVASLPLVILLGMDFTCLDINRTSDDTSDRLFFANTV